MTTEQKLARISNRQTRYELIAFSVTRGAILIGYTHRKSRHGLLGMLRQHLMAGTYGLLFDTQEIQWGRRAADGGTIGEYQVSFSGRTQREAILNGELQFIGDLDGKYCRTDLAPALVND